MSGGRPMAVLLSLLDAGSPEASSMINNTIATAIGRTTQTAVRREHQQIRSPPLSTVGSSGRSARPDERRGRRNRATAAPAHRHRANSHHDAADPQPDDQGLDSRPEHDRIVAVFGVRQHRQRDVVGPGGADTGDTDRLPREGIGGNGRRIERVVIDKDLRLAFDPVAVVDDLRTGVREGMA